jgi:predicted aldo/keto reductase-like oxidoreductase
MERRVLGGTGIEVGEVCFGTLPMGPLQKNLPVEAGAQLIGAALERGINFIDTAQMYQTYAPIREAMRRTGIRPVIASKSTASTYREMRSAVDQALNELEIDCIDIFHLHAARSGPEVFEERGEALQCLRDLSAQGVIKVVGIATHHVAVVARAAQCDDLDVVFPIFNKAGKGILGGTVGEMAAAIGSAFSAGKGVYLMKTLAGGMLINDFQACLDFARTEVPSHAIAIGMVHPEELAYNLQYFDGVQDLPPLKSREKRVLVLRGMCLGCQRCRAACHSQAITMKDEKAHIDQERCIRCGYCTALCPQFAIRVV